MKRKLFDEIYNHLNHKEYTIITGSRQVGKTTSYQNTCLSDNENNSLLRF
ncbi:MAG: hypothetical protein HY738_03185 [Bacteroidia bacterium]|nr:hypothetical protein [Bacteroidia bacterium]